MTRQATWSNPDGLIVGFGPNYPERIVGGVANIKGRRNEAYASITYQSTLGASGAKITVPAGSAVRTVVLKVGAAWTGGTSLAFGDATTPAGWITATQGATANLTLNAMINAQGSYAFTATEGQLPPKVYAAATDLYFTVVGTFTAGSAQVMVEYYV